MLCYTIVHYTIIVGRLRRSAAWETTEQQNLLKTCRHSEIQITRSSGKAARFSLSTLFTTLLAQACFHNSRVQQDLPLEPSACRTYRCLRKHTPFVRAFTLEFCSRSCSPAPDLALQKPISPRLCFSGGVFLSQTPVCLI